jgi:hypothetical protein
MNPELLSANISLGFMAAAAVALLASAIRLTRGERFSPLLDAVAAAGLLSLFATSAFGWNVLPRAALFALYAAIFALLAAMALLRLVQDDRNGAPLGGAMIQQAAMAYLFAPGTYWKPALSALLCLYFLFLAVSWLRGSEPQQEAERKDPHPPLFPPRRLRGAREFAGAALTAALVYVFAMGTGKAPVAPPPLAPVAQEEPAAAEPAAAEPESASEAPTTEAAPTYTTVAGDTFKSIAKKLYGKAEKWRALAAANPGMKPGAKVKAGVIIKLSEPPAR